MVPLGNASMRSHSRLSDGVLKSSDIDLYFYALLAPRGLLHFLLLLPGDSQLLRWDKALLVEGCFGEKAQACGHVW